MIEFIITTLIVYCIYYFLMINKYDKDGKLKKGKNNFLNKIVSKVKQFAFGTKSEKEEILMRGRKNKKVKEDKEDFKIPTEVEILIVKYHVDLSKINYKKLLKIVGWMCSIDIGFIIAMMSLIPTENIYIELLVGALLIIPVILISYSIVGNYFKKKGLVIKNEKRNATSKRNRK